MIFMAKSKALEEAHDALKDIYDIVQEAGSTRAEMEEALDKIANLCTEELPELDESEPDETAEEDGDDED
jgi:ArsR family metal-binding transcriptional regulator